MDHLSAGFREIEHTADWQLEAWAPDLAGLLEQAARGMYYLSGARQMDGPRFERSIQIEANDPEALLVRFLSELLYILDQESLVFDRFMLDLRDYHLAAHLSGMPLASVNKEIKAVTYHQLNVRSTSQGLTVNIVFDV